MTFYNNSTTVTAYYCTDGYDNLAFIVTFYQLFVLFVIPGIFMTACYFIVIKVLWSSTKTMERLTAHVGTGIRDTTSLELSRVGRRLTSPSTSYTSLATNGFVSNTIFCACLVIPFLREIDPKTVFQHSMSFYVTAAY